MPGTARISQLSQVRDTSADVHVQSIALSALEVQREREKAREWV